MVLTNLLLSVFYAVIASFIVVLMAYRTYRSIKHPLVISTILIFIWAFILIFTNILIEDQAISGPLSIVGVLFLSSSLFLNHFHFDDQTALFRQRFTMLLASLAYGATIASLIYEDAITRDVIGTAQVKVIVLVSLLIQAGLMVYRFYFHLVNQNSLSQHYALQSRYSSIFEKYGIFFVVIIFIVSALIAFALHIPLISGYYILIPSGYLMIIFLLYKDPLSSAPIGQKINLVALLSDNKIKYIHNLASQEESLAQREDFGPFLSDINQLLQEIARSEANVRSISTNDVLVMFEPCGNDILVFILQYRGPTLSKLLVSLSKKIISYNVSTQNEFSSLVESTLLRTKQDLRVISLVNKSWVILVNEHAANYKKGFIKWNLYIERGNLIELHEFTPDWIVRNKPSHILVMGGDGTVHYTVNQLIKSGKNIPIGILPGGGGNDIARRWSVNHRAKGDLSIIQYLDTPIMKISYPDHAIYAVNTIEWGVGAPTAKLREENYGRLLFGMAKYFYLVIKALSRFEPWKSKIVIDGEELHFDQLSAVMIGFGNSSVGGGFDIFPDEHRNSQWSYVLYAKNYQRFQGLNIMFKLARGKQYGEDNIDYKRFKNLELVPLQENVNVLTVDGEIMGVPPVSVIISETKIITFTII